MCAHNGGMTNTNAAAARTFYTSSGKMHLLAEVAEVIENGYVADPSTQVQVKARLACNRTYTGTASQGAGDLDSITCDRCAAAVEIMRAAAARLDALPTEEPEVEEIPEAKPAKKQTRAERIAAAGAAEAARCAASSAKVEAWEPHAFSAKGSAKASACVHCGCTWAAAAHRKHRAAA